MDLPLQSVDLSVLHEHLPMFAFLLFSLPPIAFLAIKVWLTAKESAQERARKQWCVSRDVDESGRPYYFDPDAEPSDASGQQLARSLLKSSTPPR